MLQKLIAFSLIVGVGLICIGPHKILATEKSQGTLDTEKIVSAYNEENKIMAEAAGFGGKYITVDLVNEWASYLPELELAKGNTFTLSTGINCFLKGSYSLNDQCIILNVNEDKTRLIRSQDKSIVLKIQDKNTLILTDGLSGVIKKSAVFKKASDLSDKNEDKASKIVSIRGSKDGVKDFLALQGQLIEQGLANENDFSYDVWYNVTPKEVAEKGNCQIFKSSESCASFLLYKDKVYGLGIGFGGLGVLDSKLCDFDKNGEYELLYTYSWGSGLHRSHVGHFDLKTQKQTHLDYVYLNEDMMLVENPDGSISLYHAKVKYGEKRLIDFELTARNPLADVVYKEGKLRVVKNPSAQIN